MARKFHIDVYIRHTNTETGKGTALCSANSAEELREFLQQTREEGIYYQGNLHFDAVMQYVLEDDEEDVYVEIIFGNGEE